MERKTQSDLEQMLVDETADPMALPLSLLEDITGGFSDDQEIGRGGFAVVYKGILGDRAVAVKRLSDAFMDETKFHREIKCLMQVKHKNVVRFLGYCADRQGSMERYNGKLVMADVHQRLLCFEYISKGSLDKYIIDAHREWEMCYKIIKGICEGLQYLHENHIVHLDLKPANILLDENMIPKITDFGLSRCFDENQSQDITKTIVGTMGYLAPEFPEGGVIARSADLYSLGVIIFEILTGQKGYQSAEDVLVGWSDRLESSQRRTLCEEIRVCYNIALECRDFDPKKRPASVRNIIDRFYAMESMMVLDAQRKSRITHVAKIPKVNRFILENIRGEEEELDAMDNVDKSSARKIKRRLEMNKAILTDPRFLPMFENKDYEIDKTSREYLALHPQVATKEPLEEYFERYSEDEDQQDAGSSDASAESDSDSGMHNSKRVRLYEVKDDRHAEAFLNSVSLGGEEALPLGDRVVALERQRNSRSLDKVKYGPGGSREISFIARSSRRRNEEEDEHSEEEPTCNKRRSVQSLGLKQNKAEFYLFGGSRGRGGGGGGRGRGGGGDRGRRGGGGRGRGGGGRGGGRGDFGGGGGGGSEFGGRGGGGRGRGMRALLFGLAVAGCGAVQKSCCPEKAAFLNGSLWQSSWLSGCKPSNSLKHPFGHENIYFC